MDQPERDGTNDTSAFDELESAVRTYCRWFPTVFRSAKGARIVDEAGRSYIDFFAGAGALNYGHNPGPMRDRLVAYLQADGLTHALDMFSTPKREFLRAFASVILGPRGLDHRLQFCGPTGADAVEASLKLARLATGRFNVCFFAGGWHGMTLGCLSVNSNRRHRETAGLPGSHTTALPFPVAPERVAPALAHIEELLVDPWSGVDLPAAFLVESVQAEGGVHPAPEEFLQGLSRLCREHGILLIVDDIQAGCGRTGPFFSFEPAGIVPDVVLLSKSLSGMGLPMSLVLIRPQHDVWKPGQHTATFRGHQLAFVTATAALDHWRDAGLEREVERKAALARAGLDRALARHPGIEVRGRGLLLGVDLARAGDGLAAEVVQRCFAAGLLVEACGRGDSVIKLLPPLTIEDGVLEEGLQILVAAVGAALAARAAPPAPE